MRDASPPVAVSKGRKLAAWAVHGLTAAGAGLGFMALVAFIQNDARTAWLLLGGALLIDGVDGSLARAVGVRHVVPNINGSLLDLIVDYLNYVIVPVAVVFQFQLLPENFLIPGCLFILVTSLYAFCRTDLITADHCFLGFPAIWNVVVFYFFALETGLTINMSVVLILGLLTFGSFKTIHPVRVREFRTLNVVMLLLWSGVALIFLVSLPARQLWTQVLLALAAVYFIGVSLWLSLRARGSKQSNT